MSFAGQDTEQRQVLRQKFLDAAVARAETTGLTARCKRVASDLDHPDHHLCRGESAGGAGCLCRCHDRAAEGSS